MPDELDAITKINGALEGLQDLETRTRVLEWAWKKFGPATATPTSAPTLKSPQPPSADKGSDMSAAQIIRGAKPSSGTQQVIVLAYWLEKYGAKASWSTGDLKAAFDAAKIKQLSNTTKYVRDAIRQGFVRGDGDAKTLTQAGEVEVEKLLAANRGA